jgi:hypothetical protein
VAALRYRKHYVAMTPERWHQIETLYHAVLRRAPVERTVFLNQNCNGDSDLRREVESLLVQHASRDGALDRPAFEGVQSLQESGMAAGT